MTPSRLVAPEELAAISADPAVGCYGCVHREDDSCQRRSPIAREGGDSLFPFHNGSRGCGDRAAVTGLSAWMPEPEASPFNTDRAAGPARLVDPLPPRTLRERIEDAVAGAVNGWKGAL